MDGSVRFHGESVVIDNFDFMNPVCFPEEADAPWVVDADGVLAFPVSLESFEAITGRDREVVEFSDCMELG